MDYQEFYERVHHRGGFRRRRDTTLAIRATLTALGERLPDDEKNLLERGLPDQAGRVLELTQFNGESGLQEFYERVQELEGLDFEVSMAHARIVCQQLLPLIDEWALSRLRRSLPVSFSELFDPALEYLAQRSNL